MLQSEEEEGVEGEGRGGSQNVRKERGRQREGGKKESMENGEVVQNWK